jgi:hypothetical protein
VNEGARCCNGSCSNEELYRIGTPSQCSLLHGERGRSFAAMNPSHDSYILTLLKCFTVSAAPCT